MAPADCLIIFSRFPRAGASKTRLIPALGPQAAADLQRMMTVRVVSQARRLAGGGGLELQVHLEGGSPRQGALWLGPDLSYRRQAQGDIGQRMAAAFAQAFAAGARRVVLVGSDLPGLDHRRLGKALAALARSDLVLGPAADGGYYLVGLRRPAPALFEHIPWSSETVLARTLAKARRLGLRHQLVEQLSDLDRPGDLDAWQQALGPRPVSVIIPALNEAAALPATLASLEAGRYLEVLLVDGGSSDGTMAAARSWGARVVASPPGRGGQMNRGAALASGEVLLFLHADTRAPADYHLHIARTLDRAGVAAGAFGFRLDAPGAALRLVEHAVHWRSRLAQLPYGDQGLFLSRRLFWSVGGFPDMALMEDVAMIRRLRRQGRIALAPAAVVTSARRWQRLGVARATLENWLTYFSWRLGASPQRLARRYYRC